MIVSIRGYPYSVLTADNGVIDIQTVICYIKLGIPFFRWQHGLNIVFLIADAEVQYPTFINQRALKINQITGERS